MEQSENNIEEHEIEKLYSFKDFVKYKCDFIILTISTILIIINIIYLIFKC